MSNTSDTTGGSGRWADDREAASRGVEREAQSAREEAAGAAGTIRDEASKLVSGARQKAEEQVEQGKSAAASSLEDFTAAIRKASDELAGVALGRFARASGDHADREHLRGGPARPSDRASASARSQRTSIPSDGLNHSDPVGTPITRVGSSGFEASRTTGAASRPTGAEFGASGSSGTTGTEGLAGSSPLTKDVLR